MDDHEEYLSYYVEKWVEIAAQPNLDEDDLAAMKALETGINTELKIIEKKGDFLTDDDLKTLAEGGIPY